MKACKLQMVGVCFFLAALAAAHGQNGTIGIDFGEASDKFGSLNRTTAALVDVTGKVIVLHGNQKEGFPNVVAGGEARFPSDTTNHVTEFAVFGGLEFRATQAFTAGFHVQVRKILMPSSTVQGQLFNRENLELLEVPLFLEYKFGKARHVFVQAEGAPEFRPRFRASKAGPSPLPNPSLDHAYFLRGSLGYNFGKWYAKGTYQTRYFKFGSAFGNPSGLYNWRSDFATVGVGLNF